MTDNVCSLPTIKSEKVRAEITRIALEDTENVILLDQVIESQIYKGIYPTQVFKVLIDGKCISEPRWCSEREPGWLCTLSRATAGSMVTADVKLVERASMTCLVLMVLNDKD